MLRWLDTNHLSPFLLTNILWKNKTHKCQIFLLCWMYPMSFLSVFFMLFSLYIFFKETNIQYTKQFLWVLLWRLDLGQISYLFQQHQLQTHIPIFCYSEIHDKKKKTYKSFLFYFIFSVLNFSFCDASSFSTLLHHFISRSKMEKSGAEALFYNKNVSWKRKVRNKRKEKEPNNWNGVKRSGEQENLKRGLQNYSVSA